ncbi:hypothetical protein CYK06_04485 [Staphylococcus hominis]|nr:hypothetical protein CYK06_04485 [Staphylococcus hominis]
MYRYDITHIIALILNIFFIIFMPLTFKYGNVYITIIWIILGAINAIYIYRKNTKMKKDQSNKKKLR